MCVGKFLKDRTDLKEDTEMKAMNETTLSQLKRGEYFTLKPFVRPTADQVFIKGAFDRKENKYDCERYNAKCRDGASRMIKGDHLVYTGFVF